MYLPTLPTLVNASTSDVLNEVISYLEIATNTLVMMHDSEPDGSHLKPILLGLESHLFNSAALINHALEHIVEAQISEVSNHG